MNKNNIRLIIFLLNLLPASNSLQSALPAGTLVKITQGNIPIEYLSTGDNIIGCNIDTTSDQNFLSECRILATKNFETTSALIVIKIAQGILKASTDHLFFDASTNAWERACKLTNNSKLITANGKIIDCVEITSEQSNCRLHQISLEEPHIFFISEHEILVHNEPVSATAALIWAAPLLPLPLTLPAIGIGVVVAGIGVGVRGFINCLHQISLEEPHVFFISGHEILVHNEPVSAAATLHEILIHSEPVNAASTLVWAAPLLPPPLVFPVIGIGVIVGIGVGVGKIIKGLRPKHRHIHHEEAPQQPEPNNEVKAQEAESPSPSPEQPEDSSDDEKKKKDENPSNDEDQAKDKDPKKDDDNGRRVENFSKQSEQELLKSKESHEKLVEEHKVKLAEYIKNPDSYDNKGLLKNASSEIREKIIEGRIKALQKQIARQETDLKIINELLNRS